MSKDEKYQKIAKLLFGRLIVLQRESRNIAETIEKVCRKNKIKILIEIGDFIPLIEFAKILELPNEDGETIMYDELDEIIESNENSDLRIEKFLEKYI